MRIPQTLLLQRKYRVIMWDVVTRDYSPHMTPEGVLQVVKRYTRTCDGHHEVLLWIVLELLREWNDKLVVLSNSCGNSSSYDLCISTSRLGTDGVVDFIEKYIDRL